MSTSQFVDSMKARGLDKYITKKSIDKGSNGKNSFTLGFTGDINFTETGDDTFLNEFFVMSAGDGVLHLQFVLAVSFLRHPAFHGIGQSPEAVVLKLCFSRRI